VSTHDRAAAAAAAAAAAVEDGLRLSVYFGERDFHDGRLLAEELIDVYARHRVQTSVLLRGIEGFGIKHQLATERLLTLSEDLPLLALAVDTPERIEGVAAEVRALSPQGTITLERARLLRSISAGIEPDAGSGEVKLTVYVGRQERVAGAPAYVAIVDCLHRHGVAGASVMLGLDGTIHGIRRRARFLARNEHVPLMIQSVGERARIERALAALAGAWSGDGGTGAGGRSVPAMTLERVRVCKRDGELLAEPERAPDTDADGLAYWQKLVVYTSERSRHEQEPVHGALVRRLRLEGAAGATALRGQWGYHGAHRPHGEAFWSLARHVPVLTLLLDTPANMGRWFAIVDELTRETGLVTSELVPALRAAGPGIEHGGLELAARRWPCSPGPRR
jgi:PII-like signaling protein